MKKSLLLGPMDPKIRAIARSLERGSLYLTKNKEDPFVGSFGGQKTKVITMVIQLTHFYKSGIRIKILASEPKMNTPKKHLIRTIRYSTLQRFEFTKLKNTDLPLYINNGTPLFQEYLKNHT